MSKWVLLPFLMLLVAPQQKIHTEAIDPLGLASNAITLTEFIWHLLNIAREKTEIDNTMKALEDLSTMVAQDLETISRKFDRLKSIFAKVLQEHELETYFRDLSLICQEALRKKKEVLAHNYDHESRYEDFRDDHEKDIDKYMRNIKALLTSKSVTSYLYDSFQTQIQAYNNVCEMKMSQMQFFTGLLNKLKIAFGEYYVTKVWMLEFFEINKPEIHKSEKKRLLQKVIVWYRDAVREYKSLIVRSSREYYVCSTSEFEGSNLRENGKEPAYYELKPFTRYILPEASVKHSTRCDGRGACAAFTNVKRDTCYSDSGKASRFCEQTRFCPNKLVACDDLISRHPKEKNLHFCYNDEKESFKRYTRISAKQDTCDKKEWSPSINARFTDMAGSLSCRICDCVCPEEDYYISLEAAESRYEQEMIVIGAKLTVMDNTLHLQIKEGQILGNGTMYEGGWTNVRRDSDVKKVKISWNELREIILGGLIAPRHELVVGLQFVEFKDADNVSRIFLKVHTRMFNPKTGGLSELYTSNSDEYPNTEELSELDLSNTDVPTKARYQNYPDSKNLQVVKFTTSSLEKDGGQSTVPFIDGQEVVPSIITPLAGAALFHKGQKGFGGFLALKLYTYDSTDQIDEDFEYKPQI